MRTLSCELRRELRSTNDVRRLRTLYELEYARPAHGQCTPGGAIAFGILSAPTAFGGARFGSYFTCLRSMAVSGRPLAASSIAICASVQIPMRCGLGPCA